MAAAPDELSRRLALLAAGAPSLRAYREGVLDLLAEALPYDAAMMHAGSPRVPLSTAALRGIDEARVSASAPRWDAWAVELGRLRDVAMAREGVATDRDALPAHGAARDAFERAIRTAMGRRPRGAMFVHLVVRARIGGLLVLLRFSGEPFAAEDAARMRALAPAIAAGDALHTALDGAPRASVPVRLECVDGRLTPRQRGLVEHVALGHTNAAIAEALSLSPNTVRNALADVMKRLGAANRADVVRLAVIRPA